VVGEGISPSPAHLGNMKTVETIIKEAVATALGLKKDEIENDIIDIAIDKYNFCGRIIFDVWPWKEKKIDQFTISADDDGIILFNGDNADVDIVRAVKAVASDDSEVDVFVWPQNEVSAAIQGVDVSSARFLNLANDDDGYRRIQVNVDDEVTTYAVLAMKRFVESVIDDSYDPVTPTDTPTDYRVLTWRLEDANSILISYIIDELKAWDGQPRDNLYQELLKVPIQKAKWQEANEHITYPVDSDFEEIGLDF